jgi:DNA-binding NtrC family response regulator
MIAVTDLVLKDLKRKICEPGVEWLAIILPIIIEDHSTSIANAGMSAIASQIFSYRVHDAENSLWEKCRQEKGPSAELLTVQAVLQIQLAQIETASTILQSCHGIQNTLKGVASSILSLINLLCAKEASWNELDQFLDYCDTKSSGKYLANNLSGNLFNDTRVAISQLADNRFLSTTRKMLLLGQKWDAAGYPCAADFCYAVEILAWKLMQQPERVQLCFRVFNQRCSTKVHSKFTDGLHRHSDKLDANSSQMEKAYLYGYSKGAMFGRSDSFLDLVAELESAASANLPVLLQGETGTGKELAANYIHDKSSAKGKFVAINCSTIPANIFESEFFGCTKGAFTGASDRGGFVDAAREGTLFLDEFATLPMAMQPKLLRFLESGEYYRVGDSVKRKAKLRLIAASNESALLAGNEFRDDLLYRISGFRIRIPGLLERVSDIELLIRVFLVNDGLTPVNHPLLRSDILKLLESYHWPGNIRQLKFVVLRSAILAKNSFHDLGGFLCRELGIEGLVKENTANFENKIIPLREAAQNAERIAINRALSVSAFDKKQAADQLGISLPTLYSKLKQHVSTV